MIKSIFKKLIFFTFMFPIFMLMVSCNGSNLKENNSESESEIESIVSELSITISDTERSICVGESFILTIDTNSLETNLEIEWLSSDETIVTVEDGQVTGISVGSAIITAIIKGEDVNLSCFVEVSLATSSSEDSQTPETEEQSENPTEDEVVDTDLEKDDKTEEDNPENDGETEDEDNQVNNDETEEDNPENDGETEDENNAKNDDETSNDEEDLDNGDTDDELGNNDADEHESDNQESDFPNDEEDLDNGDTDDELGNNDADEHESDNQESDFPNDEDVNEDKTDSETQSEDNETQSEDNETQSQESDENVETEISSGDTDTNNEGGDTDTNNEDDEKSNEDAGTNENQDEENEGNQNEDDETNEDLDTEDSQNEDDETNEGLDAEDSQNEENNSNQDDDYDISVEVETYNIYYENIDGATNSNSLSYISGIEVTLENPTKYGYEFLGWYTSEDLCETKIDVINEDLSGDIILYAKWEEIILIASIHNEEQISKMNFSISSSIILENVFKENYTFCGWYLDSNFSENSKIEEVTFEIANGQNIDVYAKFEYGTEGIEYLFEGETATIVGYSGEATNIVIPKIFNGYDVTLIASSAFSGNTLIESLLIEGNDTIIEDDSFYGCTTLETVTLSGKILSIGKNCFYNCTSLKIVEIDAEVEIIGDDAFKLCKSLSKVMINDLESWCLITFGNSLSNPLSYANHLYLNGEEITFLEIPNTISQINEFTFYCCININRVLIPENITQIGTAAFSGCPRIVEVINYSSLDIKVGDNENGLVSKYAKIVHSSESIVTTTGDGYQFIIVDDVNILFNYLGNEIDLVLPENFNGEDYIINDYAFYKNLTLKSIYISSNVTSIGNYAFSSCTNLESVVFEENSKLESIGKYAFKDCDSLTEVYFTCLTGWKAGSKSISSSDLEDSYDAADLLREKYYKNVWTRTI